MILTKCPSKDGYFLECMVVTRPTNWIKIVRPDAEECYWVAPDGTQHPGTPEENAAVKRELLEMRTIADKRRQQKLAERD